MLGIDADDDPATDPYAGVSGSPVHRGALPDPAGRAPALVGVTDDRRVAVYLSEGDEPTSGVVLQPRLVQLPTSLCPQWTGAAVNRCLAATPDHRRPIVEQPRGTARRHRLPQPLPGTDGQPSVGDEQLVPIGCRDGGGDVHRAAVPPVRKYPDALRAQRVRPEWCAAGQVLALMVADQLHPLAGLALQELIDQPQGTHTVRAPVDQVADLDHHHVLGQGQRFTLGADHSQRPLKLVEVTPDVTNHHNGGHVILLASGYPPASLAPVTVVDGSAQEAAQATWSAAPALTVTARRLAGVDRQTLTRLLDSDNEAWAMCQAAVQGGARFHVYAGDGVPADLLASIYARRLSFANRRGTWTVGFAEAVAHLRTAGTQVLRLGSVDIDEPHRHFLLFLDEGLTAVIACLGIEPPPHGRRQYRIERGDNGELRLYRGDALVDTDREHDGNGLGDIERWASAVAWHEDGTAIQRWNQQNPDGHWTTLIGVAYRYVTYEFDVGHGPVTVWDELDSDNSATRHVEAVNGHYTVAAALAEVLAARDTGGSQAVQAYERRYGVCPEAAYPPDIVASLTTISAREFAEHWAAARHGRGDAQA